MNITRDTMIDLFKKLMKGEIKTIKSFEPVFDLVERGAQFDYNEDSIIVTLWNSVNRVREKREIVADRGLAWCYFKQAIWCADSIEVWDNEK